MEMQEIEILIKLKEFGKKLPKFSDGRINYTKSNKCLVLTVFIVFNNKILLLKRSEKVSTYKNKWNTVTGYIDEKKPIYNKILDEIKEELGITKKDILSYNLYESFEFEDKKINKKWIIYPSKIELKNNPKIKLDWEHSEYKWIYPKDLFKYDIVPKLDLSLNKVIK
ncbi:NUDIX domain-containing protein [Thermoplasmatota archaeon]